VGLPAPALRQTGKPTGGGEATDARALLLQRRGRLRVPYGRHPLESRLRWTGITARPRQEGFYRGLLPLMEEILRGKRNDSILRVVRNSPCGACGGTRLSAEADWIVELEAGRVVRPARC
jgi:excinuclease ABC subunit A